MKLVTLTTAFALTAGAVFAQDATPTDAADFAAPKMSFLEVAGIADAQGNGELIAMELDYDNENDPVYIADIEGETAFTRLMIDGDTGTILATESVNAANEEALVTYLEHFSTQAELAEMMELAEMLDVVEDHDMTGEDIAAMLDAEEQDAEEGEDE